MRPPRLVAVRNEMATRAPARSCSLPQGSGGAGAVSGVFLGVDYAEGS